ncbi:metal-sensitive transcriptional regulator [Sphingomonas baiyangensis]|uniref:Metal-sensitive transcriptional regulator n=1 Tax=Sphingomonas baiyangensis TaxID=2572576 RepID=A0A4U1L1T7_9SPHN|nr:metal-sensitive transcriptional regulator [Sphingomonas baiyangensis]TKD49905.1 metal-sensitive transcriptional regulator [Sphingomonas baiyangensis]
MQNADRRTAKVNRFNRIAGQVRGIAQMIEQDRYCIDILQQVAAVRAALARAEAEVLRDHADSCVAEAIASGDPAAQRAKVDELIALFDHARR